MLQSLGARTPAPYIWPGGTPTPMSSTGLVLLMKQSADPNKRDFPVIASSSPSHSVGSSLYRPPGTNGASIHRRCAL